MTNDMEGRYRQLEGKRIYYIHECMVVQPYCLSKDDIVSVMNNAVLRTLARTFSNDAGLISEKQMRNTSYNIENIMIKHSSQGNTLWVFGWVGG